MHQRPLLGRRPSASMVVALVALFMALGGAGWAAIQLPPNSVGSAQIRNLAVGYRKIQFGTVGARRINRDQVQARVNGRCSGTKGAIGSIDNSGGVACASTVPNEFGSSASSVALKSTSTTVTTKTLPGGSNYLVLANPSARITSAGAGAQTTVTCTLSVGSATQSRSVIVTTGGSGSMQQESIPLQLAAGPGTASVACSSSATGASPAVAVTSAINAIQTAGNS